MNAELERRHANVRAAMARARARRARRLRERVLGLRGRGDVPLRLPDRPPLRVRRRPRGRRRVRRLPDRGALRRRARDGRARAGLPRPPGRAHRGARARSGVEAGRRVRARLRHARARLPRARGPRARPVRRRVRPRPRGEERGRARVRARLRADQRARVRGLPRGLRAREERGRGHGRGGGVVRRRGLRAPDHEHGAHGDATRSRGRSSRSRGARRCSASSCSRRSRSPGRGCTGSRSRARSPRAGTTLSDDTERMLEAYVEYFEAARDAMRPGATCHDVHRAVSAGFAERGYHLGHVTGHSIGMTMIEFPKVGEGVETELRENMVFSHAPARDRGERGGLPVHAGDLARHARTGGEPLSSLPMQVFTRVSRARWFGRPPWLQSAVSWPWLVVLVLAAALLVAVEWPRLAQRFGADARREREPAAAQGEAPRRHDRGRGERRVHPQRPERPRRAPDDRGARQEDLVVRKIGIPLARNPDRAKQTPLWGARMAHLFGV